MAGNRAVAFFGLLTVLTAPFWVLGAFVKHDFLPGLPISALAVVCPALAAGILSFREGGGGRLLAFLQRAVDFRNVRRWLIPAIFINPVLFSLAFVVSSLLGVEAPRPTFSIISAAVLFALFLPTAMLEELGWSGYALDCLQSRVSPHWAAVSLGTFWALWHLPNLVEAGRSLEWIAWWSVWTVAARIIMVCLYNWAGLSVTAVAFYHAASNLCWQLYPISGSYFDPRISGLITLAMALVLSTLWPTRCPKAAAPHDGDVAP